MVQKKPEHKQNFCPKHLTSLVDLGLTGLQARVYFALLNNVFSVNEIIKAINLSRSSIYSSLAKLQQAGYIEKVSKNPNRYSAITLDEFSSSIVQENEKKKEKRFKQLQEVSEFAYGFGVYRQDEEELTKQLRMLAPGKSSVRRLAVLCGGAQVGIDVICGARFSLQVAVMLYGTLVDALKRGVRVRCLVCKESKGDVLPEVFVGFSKYSCFKLKTVFDLSGLMLMVRDGGEAVVCSVFGGDVSSASFLWTNNFSLVSLVQSYFNIRWRDSRLIF